MNAHVHPIFQHLFAEMGQRGLLPADEQRAGETFAASAERRADTRTATPLPHLPNRQGSEL